VKRGGGKKKYECQYESVCEGMRKRKKKKEWGGVDEG
jgi:hypothetical protein